MLVVTGGEPALQWDVPLAEAVRGGGFRVHMETNGTRALAQPLQGPGTLKTWDAPVVRDSVPVSFTQSIGANESLRTGTYAKTVAFTLSTTAP